MLSLTDYYEKNNLQQAIEELQQQVILQPDNLEKCILLAELFCLNDNLIFSDKLLANLNSVFKQDSSKIVLEISSLRQLISAALYRQNLFQNNTLPNFIENPPLHLTLHLEGFIALHNSENKKAQQLLREAAQERPILSGKYNNSTFCYFRDLDDLTASFIEIFMPCGQYYWIPLETIQYLHFSPPDRPIELIWRKATLQTKSCLFKQVYIPTIYNTWYNTSIEEDLPIWRTYWKQYNNFLTLGRGQKIFLFDEEPCSMMKLATLQITGKS